MNIAQLREAGFSDAEIKAHYGPQLLAAGFTRQEIDAEFGGKRSGAGGSWQEDKPLSILEQRRREQEFGTYKEVNDSSAGEELVKGLKQGGYGVLSTLGTLAKVAGARDVGQKITDFAEQGVWRNRPDQDVSGNVIDDPGLMADPKWLAHGLGQMAPGLVAAAIPGGAVTKLGKVVGLGDKAAKYAGIITAGATGGIMEGASTYEDTLRETGDESLALRNGAGMALGSAALNSLSFGKMLSGKTKSKLIRAVTSGLTEATTESLEEPLDAMLQGKDPVNAWLTDGLNVMLPSLILGGAGGMAGNSLSREEKDEIVNALDAVASDEQAAPDQRAVAQSLIDALHLVAQQKWDEAEREARILNDQPHAEARADINGERLKTALGEIQDKLAAPVETTTPDSMLPIFGQQAEQGGATVQVEPENWRSTPAFRRTAEQLVDKGMERRTVEPSGLIEAGAAISNERTADRHAQLKGILTEIGGLIRHGEINPEDYNVISGKPAGKTSPIVARAQERVDAPSIARPATEQVAEQVAPISEQVEAERPVAESHAESRPDISEADHVLAYNAIRRIIPDEDKASRAYEYTIRSFDPSRSVPLEAYATMVARYRKMDNSVKVADLIVDDSLDRHITEDSTVADVTADRRSLTEDDHLTRMSVDKVREALKELKPREQQAIQAVYFEGLSFSEAGEQMGMSKQAVKQHHDKALAKLQERFNPAVSNNNQISKAAPAAELNATGQGQASEQSNKADLPGVDAVTASPEKAAPAIDLAAIEESAIIAFPDMMEAEGGLLPLSRFTPTEQESLRRAGIVETATTSEGNIYEGVDSHHLWQRRQEMQAARSKAARQAKPETSEAQTAGKEKSEPFSRRRENGQEKTDQPAQGVRAETGEDSAAADDIRGYTYAIEKDGRVITSGGIPAMGDPTHETSRLEYYKNLAKQAGGKLYLGRKPGYKTQHPEEPLIMGKTWRQIQDMQQGKNIPETIKPTMPKDAALVYDASTDRVALDGNPAPARAEDAPTQESSTGKDSLQVVPAQPRPASKQPTGLVWIKGRQLPFTTWREIGRGKNAGKIAVNIRGVEKVIDPKDVSQWPGGEKAQAKPAPEPVIKEEPVSLNKAAEDEVASRPRDTKAVDDQESAESERQAARGGLDASKSVAASKSETLYSGLAFLEPAIERATASVKESIDLLKSIDRETPAAKLARAKRYMTESVPETMHRLASLVSDYSGMKVFRESPAGQIALELTNNIETTAKAQAGKHDTAYDKANAALTVSERLWVKHEFKRAYESGEAMPTENIKRFADAWTKVQNEIGRRNEELEVLIDDPRAHESYKVDKIAELLDIDAETIKTEPRKRNGEMTEGGNLSKKKLAEFLGVKTADLSTPQRIVEFINQHAGRNAAKVPDIYVPAGKRPFKRSMENTYFPRILSKRARKAFERGAGELYEAILKAGASDRHDPNAGANLALDDNWMVSMHARTNGALEAARIGYIPDKVTLKSGEVVDVLEHDPFVVIPQYIHSAAQRQAIIEHMGQEEATGYANEIFAALKAEGHETEAEIWQDIWRTINGEYVKSERQFMDKHGFTGFLNGAEAIARTAMLSASTLAQISGWVPIATRAGALNTVRQIARLSAESVGRRAGVDCITTAELEFAQNLGGFARNTLGHTFETEDLSGFVGAAGDAVLKATGFELSNRKLNQLASLAAMRNFADGIAYLRNPKDNALRALWGKDAASVRRALQDNYDFTADQIDRMVDNGMDYHDFMGLDIKAQRDPKYRQAMLDVAQAVQKMSAKTNIFNESVVNRPVWMSKRVARMVLAFSSYQRAMGRTRNIAMREAVKGNLRPIVTLLVGGAIAGAAQDELKRILFKKGEREPIKDNWDAFSRLVNYEINAATFGMLGGYAQDAMWAIRKNDYGIDVPMMDWWTKNVLGVVKATKEGEPVEAYKTFAKNTPLARLVDAQTKGPLYQSKHGKVSGGAVRRGMPTRGAISRGTISRSMPTRGGF